jgi:hypothetical protein
MYKATLKDKIASVRIISATFDENPSVNNIIGDKGNRNMKIKRLADYAFIKSLARKGAFISKNKMGVAFFFKPSYQPFSLKEVYYEVRFALSIPFVKVMETLKRQAYLKKHRFQGEHFYFWFFGVEKGGDQAGFELKDYLYQLSEKEQTPIILETSIRRNKVVYQRYGFTIYHTWEDYSDESPLWFMIRVPKKA